MDVFTQKVAEYITQFKTELNMMDEECYVMPKYTSDSPEVQKACDAMNQYCKASITYTMEDENVVVDKELISTWLKYDDNMQVSLDEDAVRKWMREFGKKYDTVGPQDPLRLQMEKQWMFPVEHTAGPLMRIRRQRRLSTV